MPNSVCFKTIPVLERLIQNAHLKFSELIQTLPTLIRHFAHELCVTSSSGLRCDPAGTPMLEQLLLLLLLRLLCNFDSNVCKYWSCFCYRHS